MYISNYIIYYTNSIYVSITSLLSNTYNINIYTITSIVSIIYKYIHSSHNIA